jgi:phospholipase C
LVAAGPALALSLLAAACGGPAPSAPERVAGGPTGRYVVDPGIHKIKHMVVIMQENRSFGPRTRPRRLKASP